ncbi:hypothetical protein OCS65_28645 (plasmid) [Rhodococcus aetherivorans]|uniref:Uncharacterized protein n=1 Tax=Rhodococcus aetherivorans TaxID=191292 RepID=A0AA46P2B8_9NOCA|nr:hypothetical protein [Rhodococcus aetherivorans]UYF97231.1 hypothetical protein OCS65_28645 [Rhodococcus aetherivorans]
MGTTQRGIAWLLAPSLQERVQDAGVLEAVAINEGVDAFLKLSKYNGFQLVSFDRSIDSPSSEQINRSVQIADAPADSVEVGVGRAPAVLADVAGTSNN